MRRKFLIISLSLALVWLIGFFMLKGGTILHSVLMMSILTYMQGIITGPPVQRSASVPQITNDTFVSH